MRTKDIARAYDLDLSSFELWLKQSEHDYARGVTGISVDNGTDVSALVSEYNDFLRAQQAYLVREQERQAKQQAAEQQAAAEKQQALASMLITSGFNFDGYAITKYSGYISGDDAVQMDRPKQGWITGGVHGDVGADLLSALVRIRRKALLELKEAAYALGCNAVIGVDFDYLTLDPETATSGGGTLYLPFLFAVTANGNAVIIEKK